MSGSMSFIQIKKGIYALCFCFFEYTNQSTNQIYIKQIYILYIMFLAQGKLSLFLDHDDLFHEKMSVFLVPLRYYYIFCYLYIIFFIFIFCYNQFLSFLVIILSVFVIFCFVYFCLNMCIIYNF